MGTLNPDIPSEELTRALNDAARIMGGLRQHVLMPEHLLLAFLDGKDYAAHKVLQRCAGERAFSLEDLTRAAEDQARARQTASVDFDFVAHNGTRVALGSEMLVVLDEGKAIARARDEIWVGTEDALAAMSQRGVSTAGLLQQRGVTPSALSNILAEDTLARQTTARDLVALARSGQLQPVFYREDLLRELLSILSLSHDRHVILVGPSGVGRRSLVHSLALLIAEGKGPRNLGSVVEVTEPALLADALSALRAGRRKAAGGVLFLPNIQRFFGTLLQAEFPKAQPEVQTAFLGDTQATAAKDGRALVVIGTATEPDYQSRLAPVSALSEHSHFLRVAEPDHKTTVEILSVHKPRLEADYELSLAAETLPAAATLAKRYVADAILPSAALHLLHRACALVRMGAQPGIAFRPEAASDTTVDSDDVTLAASLMTGIPVAKLGADERSRYAHMVEFLHERIIGQDEAVLAVSRAVKTARVGLKDPKRPIGSFLFLGPTGVGKTELGKALAEFLFGDEEATITLDMSEYQQDETVNRMIGAPPGYVGYEGGGQLTDAVRKRPYTVVLFDEVEKAHPRVLDVLLQVMEEGRLTDGQGRPASFSEAVIIMTSNLGSEFLTEPVLSDAGREQVMELVKMSFRPEFLNRLDEILLFHPLTQDQLRQILGLLLKKEAKLLEPRGISIEISETARSWMLAQNDHPEWGARPLRRIIGRSLREPLADFLLSADPKPGTAIKIDADPHGLVFTPSSSMGEGRSSETRT
ncbi:MAG TPA: ATP-dependent Clp protease ATP-binding subunit [Anaerolineae bacterium]|nr:ATP-dependent Clp protease ATP-binding subunit [Anaerolineae bacterium]